MTSSRVVVKVSSGASKPGLCWNTKSTQNLQVNTEHKATDVPPPLSLNYLICKMVLVLVPTAEVTGMQSHMHEWPCSLMMRKYRDLQSLPLQKANPPRIERISGVSHPHPCSEEEADLAAKVCLHYLPVWHTEVPLTGVWEVWKNVGWLHFVQRN